MHCQTLITFTLLITDMLSKYKTPQSAIYWQAKIYKTGFNKI
ncbi:hypothetical protein RG47T_0232 [Mucilaginibacter polytrichastri]|uniref:Uncharacterized protein n=1 Tax=Mucilaginibacter polytrichastri TaxID=1302689 RepID=A0A1Q5ZSQ2_9SPHI|nr:hypothetical protein RG47T_0232 [Mucilaginibacter polytrichastri]